MCVYAVMVVSSTFEKNSFQTGQIKCTLGDNKAYQSRFEPSKNTKKFIISLNVIY